MKFSKEIFDSLSRGEFLSQNAATVERRQMYSDVDECWQDYYKLYAAIGFTLERGKNCFYFSRPENAPMAKLQQCEAWIKAADFLTAFNNSFGPNFVFRQSQIVEALSTDVDLKQKAMQLDGEKPMPIEKVANLLKALTKKTFIEKIDEETEKYRVTDAYSYIMDMIECITINTPTQQ